MFDDVAPDPGTQAGRALAVLHELVEDQGKPSDGFAGMPPGARMVAVNTWREACRGKLGTGNAEGHRKAFQRASTGLEGVGLVRECGGHVSLAEPAKAREVTHAPA